MSKIRKLNQLKPGWNLAFTALLGFVSLTMVLPMALVVVVSLSSERSISEVGFTFFPNEWTLNGYNYLFRMRYQVVTSYTVTIFHTATGTLMSLSVMSMFAFVIAQKTFPARKMLTWLLFFPMLFSGGLVPTYIIITRYLHLYDTIWVYLLPSLVSAYNVIILRTFINTTIPDSLFEAARIDGAGNFRVFVSIVLPLFKAGLATIGLFNVVNRWNDWFTGLLYIGSDELVPLQTLLQKIQMDIDFLTQNKEIANTPDGIALLRSVPQESFRMACTTIIVLPILAAYPFFQRYFVQGLTIGSVKG